jgi:hypothetical protein
MTPSAFVSPMVAPLDRANALISFLVDALSHVYAAPNLEYAHGAAQHAIAVANNARTRNADGYLVIR